MRRALAVLAIVGAVAVIYGEAVPSYFFDDDFQWLVTRWTFHPSDLLHLSDKSHFYRPVIELYFWIASPLFDGSPRAFHVANIVLHAANGLLVYLVASVLGTRRVFAFVAALLFVVQPGAVAAVAWVGALAEAIGAFFGCASIYAFVRFIRSGARAWHAIAATTFALALLTHESSAVFFPLLMLANWVHTRSGARSRWSWTGAVRAYGPFVVLLATYLAVDLYVNSRHYIVAEGQYRIGWHVIRNTFEYIAALYVGERHWISYVLIAIVLVSIALRGTPRAKLGAAWMVLAILPFALFVSSGTTGRYMYLPALGLAMLLAEGLAALDARLSGRIGSLARQAAVALLVAGLAIRFGVFASKGVADQAERAEGYRTFLTSFRQAHPKVADGSVFPIDAKTERVMALRFLEAAVQWEYKNPTIRLVVTER